MYGQLLSVTPQHMKKNKMCVAAITRSQLPHTHCTIFVLKVLREHVSAKQSVLLLYVEPAKTKAWVFTMTKAYVKQCVRNNVLLLNGLMCTICTMITNTVKTYALATA